MFSFLLTLLGVALGALATLAIIRLFKPAISRRAPDRITTAAVAERVRAVGKLVGLEVNAKEIATSVRGWGWLPPILLSQARLAMIFHFEKQYAVDLADLEPSHVQDLGESPADSRRRFRITLPPVHGSLRLLDVEPYDVQAGRALGLVDVIPMDAVTQRALIRQAQDQAASLFSASEPKYEREARDSIRRHLMALLALFNIDAEITWPSAPHALAHGPAPAPANLQPEPALPPRLTPASLGFAGAR